MGAQEGTIWFKTALCLAAISSSAVYGVLSPLLPKESALHNVGDRWVGVIFSTFAFTVFIVSTPIGSYLVPRLGRRRSLLIGLVLLGVTTTMFGFVDSIPEDHSVLFLATCLVLRFAQGSTAALVEVSSFALVANFYSGAELTAALGVIEIAVGVGYMIGPVVGGVFLSLGGFLAPFLVLGAFQVPIVISLVYLLPSDDDEPELAPSANDTNLADEDRVAEKGGSGSYAISSPMVALMLWVAVYANSSFSFYEPILQEHVAPFVSSSAKLGGLFFVGSFAYSVATPLFAYLSRDPTDEPVRLSAADSKLSPLPMLSRATSSYVESDYIELVEETPPTRCALGPRGVIVLGLLFLFCGCSTIGPAPFLVKSHVVSRASLNSVACGFFFIGTGQSAAMLPLMDMILRETGPGASDTVSGLLNSAYAFGEMLGPVAATNLTVALGFENAAFLWGTLGALSVVFFLLPRMGNRSEERDKAFEHYGTFY